MPRSKPCPACGALAEVRTYVVPSGAPLTISAAVDPDRPSSPQANLDDLDVWECECGWAEDVEE